ncbi:MAG: nuclear transport factor 2 family protein [Limnohabitans sp.]|nr:nuclear transport factor 2 family protein [Limnohabitans sp.]
MFRIYRHISLFLLSLGLLFSMNAKAAGSVEMQVESLIRQALQGYNNAMEAEDTAEWLKYFSDKASRQSPLGNQSGKKDFAEFFNAEFKAFKAKFEVKQIIVHGRNAAVVFTWDAQHKASGDFLKVPMAAIYDMDSSGRFSSISYYYDTAKLGKFRNDMAGSGN